MTGNGIHPFNDGTKGNVLQLVADANRWISRDVSGDPATENPNASWPRLTYGANENNKQNSTFWLQDGRYIRLKNIEISYTVPPVFTRKFFISNMQVGFIGENLYTWSPFKLWDPETESKAQERNGSAYPINRNFTCYVKFDF